MRFCAAPLERMVVRRLLVVGEIVLAIARAGEPKSRIDKFSAVA
jgi:hypothetical protein